MRQLLCPEVVGRDAELQVLEAALADALEGKGGCVVLAGDAGMGKSRLVRELSRRAGGRGVPVVTGRAVPASSSTPFRPLTEALLQLLRDRPLPRDPALRPWLSHLAPLLPGTVEAGASSLAGDVLGGEAARGEAVLRLVRSLCPQGAVMALEDMHWADPDTVSLLEYLADNATGERLLLVVSLRGEPASPAVELARRQRGRAGVVQVTLTRLSDTDVAAMLDACGAELDVAGRARVVRASDGIPLLVEELLASPGLPGSIVDTVRARMAELPDDDRAVLEAAAVMGRHFDWEILPAATGTTAEAASGALARSVDRMLVTTDGSRFQFRHALTREAVLTLMLPPRARQVAATVLAAVDAAHPYLEGHWREVAADLAARAGAPRRAGRLLGEAGRSSVRLGALATAVETLTRAGELLGDDAERDACEVALVEALALAGRVDEAAAVATRLIGRLGDDPSTSETRIEAHLRLAQAAVAASRWTLARVHVEAAVALGAGRPDGSLAARAAVLGAELALADGDLEGAARCAEEALSRQGAGPDDRCHAYEVLGRVRRLHDLPAAASAFEAALAVAEHHDLPVWRMRALHELGTVDMFERVDVGRLLEARRLAEQMGALGTAAVLDLQLAAAFTARWDLDRCDQHASAALGLAGRLGLRRVAGKALGLMAGSASMRGDRDGTDRLAARARTEDPTDPMLPGFCRASVGMALLVSGDTDAAMAPFEEGTAALSRLPNAEPISIRALWPLVLAATGDRRAQACVDEARRNGVDAFHVNAGMLGFARAVLEGRAGRPRAAEAIAAEVGPSFVGCEAWADLARFVAAPAALADGWGEPGRWLEAARTRFLDLGLHRLAERCAVLLDGAGANPWAAEGVTDREAQVLRLVIGGLANKEIATELGVSPRTVEKHVESLLRKAGARSRTELAVGARRGTT